MSNEIVCRAPLCLIKFVLSKIIRKKHFKHNSVKEPKKGWQTIGNITKIEKEKDEIIVSLEHGKAILSFINSNVINIKISKNGDNLPLSWGIETKDNKVSNKDIIIKGKRGKVSTIQVRSNIENRIEVSVNKTENRFYIQTSSGINLYSFSIPKVESGGWYKNELNTGVITEHYLGLGENTSFIGEENKEVSFWNTDSVPYSKRSKNLYQSQPIVLALREDGFAHAIVYDNPCKSKIKIEKKKTGSSINYFTSCGGINLYIITASSIYELFSNLSVLYGYAPLPPLSVLGYHQSRWSYSSENEVRSLAAEFKEKGIPCDYIHLDIDYMDGYRIFTWNKNNFSRPQNLASDLMKDGIKLVAITDPGVKVDDNYFVCEEGLKGNHFIRKPDGSLYKGSVWPGYCYFPDFTQEDTRKWFGKHFKTLIDSGIKGFWIDMNEPSVFSAIGTIENNAVHPHNNSPLPHFKVHNQYGHLMAKAVYEGIKLLKPNERTFVLTRSAYIGTHRYAGSWTGDNNAEWSHLRLSIPMLMNMAISGQVMIGPDIGGFMGKPSSELLIRWYEAGIFYPFFRNHSINKKCSHEPWMYGKKTENIIKKIIQLRYSLIPYIYTSIVDTCNSGYPVFRPMMLDYPTDKNVYEPRWANSEYLFGKSLLVAPVLSRMKRKRVLYLPEGHWYSLDGKEYFGGKVYTVKAPLDYIPIFVKSGTVLPFLANKVQSTEEISSSNINLVIYDHKKATGEIYLDDGWTMGYKNGDFERVNINANINDTGVWYVEIKREGRKKQYIIIENIIEINKKEPSYAIFES